MDKDDLEKRIYEAAIIAFNDVKKSHPDEEFYAFALYTDGAAMTVLAAANSVAGLKNAVTETENISPQDYAYYKWTTSEWAYEGWRSDIFNEISKELRSSGERKKIGSFRDTLINAMTEAMNKLNAEKIFLQKSGIDPTLFVTITDDNDSETVENNSAKILNSPSLYRKFLSRFEV